MAGKVGKPGRQGKMVIHEVRAIIREMQDKGGLHNQKAK